MLQLKDRVQVDFDEVTKDERDCDHGRVIGLRLYHAGTHLEQPMVLIRFDRPYVRQEAAFTAANIREIEMPADDIRITLLSGPQVPEPPQARKR